MIVKLNDDLSFIFINGLSLEFKTFTPNSCNSIQTKIDYIASNLLLDYCNITNSHGIIWEVEYDYLSEIGKNLYDKIKNELNNIAVYEVLKFPIYCTELAETLNHSIIELSNGNHQHIIKIQKPTFIDESKSLFGLNKRQEYINIAVFKIIKQFNNQTNGSIIDSNICIEPFKMVIQEYIANKVSVC